MRSVGNRHYLFIRFLASYVVILMIPILIGWVAYNKAFTVVVEEVKTGNLSMLKQTQDITDNYLMEMERAVIQISKNSDLSEALDYSDTKENFSNYNMKKLLDSLNPYFGTNDFYTRYYIYLKKSNYIITPETIFKNNFFYSQVFQYDRLTYDQWLDRITNKYYKGEYFAETTVKEDRKVKSVVTYMHSIPLGFDKKAEGVIIVLIDRDKLRSLLSNILNIEDGWAYITDQNDNILVSINNSKQAIEKANIKEQQGIAEYKAHNKAMTMVYTTSSYSGWRFVAALPTKVMMEKVNNIKIVTITITAVSLIIGIIMAFMLSYRNSRPIRNMVRMIREFMDSSDTGKKSEETGKRLNEYEFIQGNIASLIGNNKHLQTKLMEQSSLVKAAFLERLFRGGFTRRDEAREIASYIGLEIAGKKFVVLVLSMYGNEDMLNAEILKEMDMAKIVVKDTLYKKLGKDILFSDINENKIAILMTIDTGEDSGIRNAIYKNIKETYEEILHTYKLSLHFAAGNVSEELSGINAAFDQANQALEHALKEGNVIEWYEDIPKHSSGYYYPLELEMKLMNTAKAGDYPEIENALKSSYYENFESRRLTANMVRHLMMELKATLVKICSQITQGNDISGEIDKIDAKQAPDGYYRQILAVYQNICDIVNENKKSKNVKLKNEMLAYIDAEYADPDISLSSIATRFGLAEAYVSQFFKEQAGENFLNYLLQKRIQHACELLENTDASIADIAARVGYNSDQVFRRAFKRMKNLSPLEFRNMNRTIKT